MDARTILILGAILLGSGSLSLFLVRAGTRNLKGLGWLAASLAAAAVGALLLAVPLPRAVGELAPDLLTLLPFVLLQVAVSELFGVPLLPRLGLGLLAALALVDTLDIAYALHGSPRIPAISLAVAAQCAHMGLQLWRHRSERPPARFCALLLFAFSGYNLLRALLVLSGLSRRWHLGSPLLVFSIGLYIAVGLGLAFGFFWMSNVSFSAQLEEMAGTDPLTRVSNRRTFLRACEKELRTSVRKGRPFSILMADLDHFKRINDRFGHEAGDQALLAAVERMQDSIRGIDVLGRWGGEEFAVLLPNANEEAAKIVAERMRANVQRAEMPFLDPPPAAGEHVQLTVSIGAATFQPHDDVPALLRRADQCLYLAKNAGRNRVLQAR